MRIYFKLALALVIFSSSLSADVPDAGQMAIPSIARFSELSGPVAALANREPVATAAAARVIGGQDGQPNWIEVVPRLKEVFEKEGVPQYWVWIAEVESGFDAKAKSSEGAVGLFQLMPETAERFGLRTAPADERVTPEKNASAAAQYLKLLRQEFGCWSLALAAYHAGEGRVRGIMKEFGVRTFEEIEPFLPAETKSYVPRVMAIVALREDQARVAVAVGRQADARAVPGAVALP